MSLNYDQRPSPQPQQPQPQQPPPAQQGLPPQQHQQQPPQQSRMNPGAPPVAVSMGGMQPTSHQIQQHHLGSNQSQNHDQQQQHLTEVQTIPAQKRDTNWFDVGIIKGTTTVVTHYLVSNDVRAVIEVSFSCSLFLVTGRDIRFETWQCCLFELSQSLCMILMPKRN